MRCWMFLVVVEVPLLANRRHDFWLCSRRAVLMTLRSTAPAVCLHVTICCIASGFAELHLRFLDSARFAAL